MGVFRVRKVFSISRSLFLRFCSTDSLKTARKCGIFGVCNDGKTEHVIHLIDEAKNPGKGADCVISLVDHYFDTYGNRQLQTNAITMSHVNYVWGIVSDKKRKQYQLSFQFHLNFVDISVFDAALHIFY